MVWSQCLKSFVLWSSELCVCEKSNMWLFRTSHWYCNKVKSAGIYHSVNEPRHIQVWPVYQDLLYMVISCATFELLHSVNICISANAVRTYYNKVPHATVISVQTARAWRTSFWPPFYFSTLVILRCLAFLKIHKAWHKPQECSLGVGKCLGLSIEPLWLVF